jgi:hypothetical protein
MCGLKKINFEANFTFEHLSQFIDLWIILQSVTLNDGVEDSIRWNLTTNGQYFVASAYELRFFGLVHSSMNTMIWKAWAPSKVKHHAWLVYQGRIWTADCLQARGWPNCGPFPLCKQGLESNDHLFVDSQFTIRVWELIKEWLGLSVLNPPNGGEGVIYQ